MYVKLNNDVILSSLLRVNDEVADIKRNENKSMHFALSKKQKKTNTLNSQALSICVTFISFIEAKLSNYPHCSFSMKLKFLH